MTPDQRQHILGQAARAESSGEYAECERLVREVLHEISTLKHEQSANTEITSHHADAHRLLGLVALDRGLHDEAFAQLREAEELATEAANHVLRARILTHAAGAHVRQANFEQALALNTEALHVFESEALESEIANVTANIGNVYRNLSEFEKALTFNTRAYEVYGALNDIEGQARTLANIGNVHWNLSEYTTALEYFGQSLALYSSIDRKAEIARLTGSIANVYSALADYPTALRFYRETLELHQQLGAASGVAIDTGNIGMVLMKQAEYAPALSSMLQALSMLEDQGMKSVAASMMGNIGSLYQSIGDYQQAIYYYSRAAARHAELNNRAGAARVTANIGSVYLELENNALALDYFDRALHELESLGFQAEAARVLQNIGGLHLHAGKVERAREMLEKALVKSRDLGDRSAEASCLHGLGEALLALKQFDEAYDSLLHSLSLRREVLHTNEGVAATHIALSSVLSELGRYEDARSHLHESETIATDLGEKSTLCAARKLKAQICAAQRDFESAYRYQLEYIELQNELQSIETRKKAEQLDLQRRTSEQERLLAAERARASATMEILHRVLPSSVAQRLVNGERVADYIPDVTILFADVVGFTPIASQLPADSVLGFLNEIFDTFDRVMERHGCQKIKTMGDGYMAVAGAPDVCDDHALRMAHAAVELRDSLHDNSTILALLPPSTTFQIRIGLHSGAVFAGVVGQKGFVYDLYSDAVNIAARMESHGVPGTIHCSADFVAKLRSQCNHARIADRGQLDIKGKGTMHTYFLEAI